MAEYRVLETSYINNALREPGDIVDLADGITPGPNLEAVEPEPEPAPKGKGKGSSGQAA